MIKKATVIGAGSWGTALAVHLSKKSIYVKMWSVDKSEVDFINIDRENIDKLPGIKVPQNVTATTNLEEALDWSNFILMVVPSQTIRQNAKYMKPFIKDDSIIVCCSKGIEENSGNLLDEVLEQELPNSKIVILSGPSHAEEVARDIPTTIISASKDINVAKYVQDVFFSPNFRVYTNNDIRGVQIGAALKNIIALCVGISDGLGFGDNTKAALMTRGIAEMARLGVAMGAMRDTFAGLSGIGDLIVTCTSLHSRNRRAGMLIGKGRTVEEAISEIKMVVEGVSSTKATYELSRKLGVAMPITQEAYNILFNAKNPLLAVGDLMMRNKKDESEEELGKSIY